MQNYIIDLNWSDKISFAVYSLYVSVIAYIYNVFLRFWKLPSIQENYNSHVVRYLPGSSLQLHSYIKVQGVKFHYVESGEKCKPFLLLLHGFLDCWLGWRHQLSFLNDHFRVIAIDLKGYGDSEKPQWRSDYEVRHIVRELHDVVIALGETKCLLIGHDIGAMLGWYLASLYPDVITKFVAISCPHPNVHWEQIYSTKDKVLNSRFIHMCQVPALAKSELLQDNLSAIDFMYHHLHKTGESDIINSYKFVFSRAKDLTGPINYLRTLPLTRIEPGTVATPTMLIVGSQDTLVSVESIVRSTAFLKDFQIKLVEGAGHAPHQEYHGQVNEYLASFLCEYTQAKGEEKTETLRGGLIGNLVSNTFKYGNSIVDNVKKTTNGVVWRPHLLKS